MGKQSAPKTQTVTQKVELPKWVEQAGEGIYNRTKAAADAMPGPYMGNLVAPLNADTLNAYDMTRASAGSAAPGVMQAQGAAAGTSEYQPEMIKPQNFLSANVSDYMSPYISNVEDAALANLEKQRLQAINQGQDAFISKGAFGGSRQAIMEGVTNAEAAAKAGELSANLRNAAYGQAQQAINADQNRALTADQSNQSAGLQGAQVRNQGALTLGNLSQLLQQTGLQGAAAVEAIGGAQRDYQSQLLAQDAAQYEARRKAAFDPIGMELAALQGVPYGQTSSTTGPAQTQGSNPLMGALGGASTGLSIAKALGAGAGMSAGNIGGAALGALLGVFSDEDEKMNKQKLGKDPATGLDMYAYDYKADVESARKSGAPMPPKRVGPMAQDIEKVMPGSTRKIGGKRIVKNLGFGGAR
jgi:hypothetical protein